MNPEAIQSALLTRISGVGSGLPPAWPNRDYSDPRPYLEILPRIADRADETLKGTALRETGRLAVNVVVEVDSGTVAANTWAAIVAALFPKGLRLAFTGGEIVVHRPVDVRGGFRDGADWKVPIVIHYEAFSS